MPESTNVVMPQVGEGISEATIVGWHKEIGDAVEEGETLLDVTTAKIDVEIPAPADGVVAEIRFPADATVPVDTVIAVIAPKGTAIEKKPAAVPKTARAKEEETEPATAQKRAQRVRVAAAVEEAEHKTTESQRRALLRQRSTPLVRRIAREEGIDLSLVPGSGLHGRVTRRDLDAYLERKRRKPEPRKARKPATPNHKVAESESIFDSHTPMVAERRSEPMSQMRKTIAEHMARSYRRSPHAFTVFEFDFTRVEKLRQRHREAFLRQTTVKLTPLVLLLKAIADVLPRFPIITAFLREEEIVYPSEINLGVAVAIPDGLLVPVIHKVDGKSIEELAKSLHDVAMRARQGKLILSDVEGGTFTVTSPGQLGCLMGIPIINQPQSAILHLGAITKIPAVVTNEDGEDSIAIRHKAVLTMGFDHRLIDGWEADSFLSALRQYVESANFSLDQYI